VLSGDFVQGIYVTILGMGLVFTALGVLMLIIMGLQWALREKQVPAIETMGFSAVAAEGPTAEGPDDEAAVAAIGVALAVWKRRCEQAQLPPPKTTVVTFPAGSEAWRAFSRLS